ncbi:MAG: toll/interleukin-1 receptor domain-containing protein [Chloroflexi bacterium]|nr:toll/interleukin-1 receptor domain-containing protein [Chloroflexota bacterium]
MTITIDELLQQPPFSQSLPRHPLSRAKAFVRDLAFGALEGHWGHGFGVYWDNTGRYEWDNWGPELPLLPAYIEKKWNYLTPAPEPLMSLSLMSGETISPNQGRYELTDKAYDLIDETQAVPVFISYANNPSSAFALLLVSRMKEAGLAPFIDISGLRGGDDWDDVLQSNVRESNYVVCLLGPGTLDSTYVRREIQLALDNNVRLIPVFHSGYSDADLRSARDGGDKLAGRLEGRQGIAVREERARDYNAAVIDILNALGISP